MEVPDIGFTPTIPELLRRAVAQYADRDLIVMADRRATYADVERQSANLAKRLLAAGLGKGARVGMHFAYSPEFLIAFLAVTRIGALALPFSTAYAPGELRRGLRRNDVHTLLIPPRLIGKDEFAFVDDAAPELAGRSHHDGRFAVAELPHLRQVWVLGGASDRSWAEAIDTTRDVASIPDDVLRAVEDDVTPADWMVVINTSGSTAEPKGVIHTHGSTIRKTAMPSPLLVLPSEQPHAVFAAMPLFWIGGLITLTAALTRGTTMVCQERFEVNQALDLIEHEKCLVVSAWLSVTQALRENPSLASRDLAHIPALTMPAAARPYGTPLGMTETNGPHLTIPHPEYGMDKVPDHLRGSLGVAHPTFVHKLVDADGTVLEGDGVEGEICVKGFAILAGMYKREREQVFDDDGYYHTGDRVRREGGLYFYTGRVTEMIKTHGNNVAPPEVEAVLESFPEVKFAFVVGIPDEARGEAVAAIVVPSDGMTIDVTALRDKARHETSSYKVPYTMIVMTEDDVPWLATGKPDKLTMKKLLTDAARSS